MTTVSRRQGFPSVPLDVVRSLAPIRVLSEVSMICRAKLTTQTGSASWAEGRRGDLGLLPDAEPVIVDDIARHPMTSSIQVSEAPDSLFFIADRIRAAFSEQAGHLLERSSMGGFEREIPGAARG